MEMASWIRFSLYFLELNMTAKFSQSYHGRPNCIPHIGNLLNLADKRQRS